MRQILSDSTLLSVLNQADVEVPGLSKMKSDIEDFIAGIDTNLKNAVQDPNRI